MPTTDPSNPSRSEDLVLTPGGFRHRSLVHPVQAGSAVRVNEGAGTIQLIDLQSEALLEEFPVEPPAGAMAPALGSGWISFAHWNNETGTPVSSFKTTWRVPPEPTHPNPDATVFLFNGIQHHTPRPGILQPVLQWGRSGAGGGSYWSIAGWYAISESHAFYSELVRVSPRDVLVGAMTLVGGRTYVAEFQGHAATRLRAETEAELNWCNETLEAYGVRACDNYPDTSATEFTAIEIQTGASTPTVSWAPVDQVADCGQHTVVVSDSARGGEVDIHYR